MADVRRVAENLEHVRDRIARAAARGGRSKEAVTLVAVTKYADIDAVRALIEAGCHDLGESRPQQLWQRADALGGTAVRWHLIGHLQRNKVSRTVGIVTLIHSCDSTRLARAVDESAAAAQRESPLPVLLEVNIAEEPAKHGYAPGDISAALPELARLDHLQIRGLMAMAGRPDDPAAARADFCRLRQLRDRLSVEAPPNIKLDELSMGMSGDFEIAIEEGATIVRVGSALFEGV